jgi:hypothetical protein
LARMLPSVIGVVRRESGSHPILVEEPLHARRRRVLDLEPALGTPRAGRVISVLRDNAFQPELAGVREDDLAVALDMLIVLDAGVLDAGRRLGKQRTGGPARPSSA